MPHGDRGPERRGVQLGPLLAGVVDVRQTGVAVGVRVTVAGEVFGRRGDPGDLISLHLGGDHRGHGLRVGAEGAYADDRVGRVDVDIGVRGVVLVDADRGQLGARDLPGPAGVGGRTARPQRHRARHQRGGLADAADDAVLLVGGDEKRQGSGAGETGALDAVGEVGDLVRVTGVVRPGEVDDAADVVLGDQLGGGTDPDLGQVGVDVGLVGVGGGVPVDPHHEELADLLLQAHPGDELLEALGGGGGGGGGCGGSGEETAPVAAAATVAAVAVRRVRLEVRWCT